MLLRLGGTERPGTSCDRESHRQGSPGVGPPCRWVPRRVENIRKGGPINTKFDPDGGMFSRFGSTLLCIVQRLTEYPISCAASQNDGAMERRASSPGWRSEEHTSELQSQFH